jgi:hypothetical protein
MPVLLVTGPPVDAARRAQVARALTDAVLVIHDVPPDKVQFFYRAARGMPTVVVHLVGSPRANHGPLTHAIRGAALSVLHSRRVRVTVQAYAADHTAKGGALRGPR